MSVPRSPTREGIMQIFKRWVTRLNLARFVAAPFSAELCKLVVACFVGLFTGMPGYTRQPASSRPDDYPVVSQPLESTVGGAAFNFARGGSHNPVYIFTIITIIFEQISISILSLISSKIFLNFFYDSKFEI